MNEEWRDIAGYEGLYQISNMGRVKSLERIRPNSTKTVRVVKERILKGGLSTSGYPFVILSDGKKQKLKMIHWLVADTFIGGTDGMDIDHIDFDKTNNILSNLQVISHLENVRRSMSGEKNHNSKSVYEVTDGGDVKVAGSILEFCRIYGLTRSVRNYFYRNNTYKLDNKIYRTYG